MLQHAEADRHARFDRSRIALRDAHVQTHLAGVGYGKQRWAAVVAGRGNQIADVRTATGDRAAEGLPDPATSSSTLDEVERRHIIEVLRKCNGKVGGKGGAAEILNLNASTLHSRMKKLGITKHKYVS